MLLDKNIDNVLAAFEVENKTLRIATKSIRSVEILNYIFDRAKATGRRHLLRGLMCYSVQEAKYLSENGYDDFLIPYPTYQKSDIETVVQMVSEGKVICLTVDSVSSVKALENSITSIIKTMEPQKIESFSRKIRIAIDLDMSYDGPLGYRMGAHRSRITPNIGLTDCIQYIETNTSTVKVIGLIGYEAHVAGLPDRSPYKLVPNFIVRWLKQKFYLHCKKQRELINQSCKYKAINLEFFNGGGSGNFRQALEDASLTEISVGSAFLQGHIFDNFDSNESYPAMCFALQVSEEGVSCIQKNMYPIAYSACHRTKDPILF